jgi:hypothetical protein
MAKTTLEGSRGHQKPNHQRRQRDDARPHLQASWPPSPTISLLLQMLVVHRLRVCIYAVLSSRFDLRAQNGCYGLYIPALPLPQSSNPDQVSQEDRNPNHPQSSTILYGIAS